MRWRRRDSALDAPLKGLRRLMKLERQLLVWTHRGEPEVQRKQEAEE